MLNQRFFWVCAIPNGPDRTAVKTSAASMRRRRLLPRRAAGVSGRLRSMEDIDAGQERRAIGPERRRPPLDGGWHLNSRLNRPLRKFWALPRHVFRFDKQPLVTKFEISIEALPGMCAAKGYAACAYRKRKRSNVSVSYEPHHTPRSAPFSFFPPAEAIFRCG